MYTIEQRQRAIDTFIRFGHSCAATVRKCGYQSETRLRGWWTDYETNDAVVELARHREPKCDEWQRRRTVEHYLKHGRNLTLRMRGLGYPGSHRNLARWVDELYWGCFPAPRFTWRCGRSNQE